MEEEEEKEKSLANPGSDVDRDKVCVGGMSCTRKKEYEMLAKANITTTQTWRAE